MNDTYSNMGDVAMVEETSALEGVTHFLWVYVPPLIIILGTTGNLLTIFTMCRKPLISTVTSPCLICLAVVDTIVLNTGLMRYWLQNITGVDFRDKYEAGCIIHRFVVYWSIRMAAWLLVFVSVERFISVCTVRFKAFCTHKNTLISMLVLGIVAALLDIHVFWTTGLQEEYFSFNGTNLTEMKCNFRPEYKLWADYTWPWIDFICASLLPFVILLGCNCGIISVLVNTHRLRSRLFSNSAMNSERAHRSNVKLTSMTAILITCSVAFFLLTAPISIYLIVQVIWTSDKGTFSNAHYTVMDFYWAMVNVLFYTNSSINFFLYTISASRFRQEFFAVIKCQKEAASGRNTTAWSRVDRSTVNTRNRRQNGKQPSLKSNGTNSPIVGDVPLLPSENASPEKEPNQEMKFIPPSNGSSRPVCEETDLDDPIHIRQDNAQSK